MCNTPPHPQDHEGPNAEAFVRNMSRTDLPLHKRVLLALRNNARKAATLSNCCGHPGEPGC